MWIYGLLYVCYLCAAMVYLLTDVLVCILPVPYGRGRGRGGGDPYGIVRGRY